MRLFQIAFCFSLLAFIQLPVSEFGSFKMGAKLILLLFFLTLATFTHSIYEMTMNPDVQERIFEEVKQVTEGIDRNDMDKYFDAILTKTPYLEAVIKVLITNAIVYIILFVLFNSNYLFF